MNNELQAMIDDWKVPFNLERAIRIFDFCRATFQSPEDEQHGMAWFTATDVYNALYASSQYILLHYRPISQHFILQLFERDVRYFSHDPIHSFICTPSLIKEKGSFGKEPFFREFRPYYRLATHRDKKAGTVSWEMTATTAPRNLEYIKRDLIPVMRSSWQAEVESVINETAQGYRRSRLLSPASKRVCEVSGNFLRSFLAEAAFPGENDEEDRFSEAFLQRLTSETHRTTLEFLSLYAPLSDEPESDLRRLREFLQVLDPTGGLIEQFRAKVQRDTANSQNRNMVRMTYHKVVPKYVGGSVGEDELGIGAWSKL